MKLSDKWASMIACKDKNKNFKAAEYIVNTSYLPAWNCLIENEESLFDFIKDKISRCLQNAFNENNINNAFEFMSVYSPFYAESIINALIKNKNEETEKRIYELLTNGNDTQKAYCLDYYFIEENIDIENELIELLKTDDSFVKNNAARNLGRLNSEKAYNYLIEELKGDDWAKFENAQLLVSFGDKKALKPILEAMTESNMSENIAGEAASIDELYNYFNDENLAEMTLEAFDSIISGLAEVWELSVLFDFKVYESAQKLIDLAKEDTIYSGKYSQLLLKLKEKMNLFIRNDIYTYDEDKQVKAELEEIHCLLISEDDDFWIQQKQNLFSELKSENIKRQLSGLRTINELNLVETVEILLGLLISSNDENVLSETVLTLEKFGKLDLIQDENTVLSKIKNDNLLSLMKATFLTNV